MLEYCNAQDRFAVVNGVRLHYIDWGGDGEPLFFLPGIGEPASVFKWFAPRFIPHFRPIAITRRGTGKSETRPGTYTIAQLVEDIHALVQYLELPFVSAVGHSYGGFEITDLASLYPDSVRNLVYLDALFSQETMDLIIQDPFGASDQLTPPIEALNSLHDYFTFVRKSYPFVDRHWCLPFEEAWLADVEVGVDGKLREIDRGPAITQMMESASEHPLEFSRVRHPMLAIEAIEPIHPNLPRNAIKLQRQQASEFQDRWLQAKRATVDSVRRQKPDAMIVELIGAPHHCYLTHGDEVYAHMADFLLPATTSRSA